MQLLKDIEKLGEFQKNTDNNKDKGKCLEDTLNIKFELQII